MTTIPVPANLPTENKDPLIPCLRAVDAVVHQWELVKRNPARMNRMMAAFPGLSVELADLSELWGESNKEEE